ncbi:MAG: suppressor of fused domain protein [Inhella sp.]|jgi:hypothetical protein|uniref:suppressor of fused domain protein n=1 Tax=Inhella sp. TaxID=1921806 RepID=UPI00391DD51D
MATLESVWEQREQVIYPQRFGAVSRGIFVLTMELFRDTFSQTEVDPRWLHIGVFEFAPTRERKSWLYVSSGLTNPWETDPSDFKLDDWSWLGDELVFEASEQSKWAIDFLGKMTAYQLLLAHGRFGEPSLFAAGDTTSLGGSINGDPESALRFVLFGAPVGFDSHFQLESGKAGFIQIVGITETERAFAREHGGEALRNRLIERHAYPVTNPIRAAAL